MKLLIDDEKIEAVVEKAFSDDAILEHRVNDRGHWEEITQIIAQAELDYLVELGIVYVKVPADCERCEGTGEIGIYGENPIIIHDECPDCWGSGYQKDKYTYIPLSDYKGEK